MHIALVLLSFCAAFGYSEEVEILATAGETVILPCHISASDELPTVEWSKKGQAETIAFLYRQGCETHEMKNPAFWYRTNLIMSELKKGNISLRIANVKLSDAGNYSCRMVTNEPHQVNTTDLFVGAVSEPKLSLYKSANGGVALLCEANCWFPKPEITFLDEQGNDIAADDPNTAQNSTGCFHVTRSMTLQAHTNRIICRVHQPKINQTRNTEIYIPENCMKSCTWTYTFIAVAVTVVACAIMAIIAAKFYISRVLGHKLPVQSPDQRATHTEEEEEEDGSLEIQAENRKNYMIELLSKIDALNRWDKDEIIRQLTDKQNELRPSSAPSQSTTDDIPSTTLIDVSNTDYLPLNQSPYDENLKLLASPYSDDLKSGSLPQTNDLQRGISKQNPATSPLNQKSSRYHSSPALMTAGGAAPPSSSSTLTSKPSVARSNTWSQSSAKHVSFRRRNNSLSSTLDVVEEDYEMLLPQE